jgi:hypothetical protein
MPIQAVVPLGRVDREPELVVLAQAVEVMGDLTAAAKATVARVTAAARAVAAAKVTAAKVTVV